MIAFLPTLGFQEMLVLLVIGLLLFGRNLPDVGRQVGRTLAQLRRGLQEFKEQMDRDGSIREVKSALRDTTAEVQKQLTRVTRVPDALTDPIGALQQLTDATLSSPAPEELPAVPAQAQPHQPAEPDQPAGGRAEAS